MNGEPNSTSAREFDVVVFGATGFVGELTARYLAEHAPRGTKVALAGRSETKLAATRKRLPARAHDWPLIVADSSSPSSLDAMLARTRVVCTTVGPYLRYGEALVVAIAPRCSSSLAVRVPLSSRCLAASLD